jgi:hypothetical protein
MSKVFLENLQSGPASSAPACSQTFFQTEQRKGCKGKYQQESGPEQGQPGQQSQEAAYNFDCGKVFAAIRTIMLSKSSVHWPSIFFATILRMLSRLIMS